MLLLDFVAIFQIARSSSPQDWELWEEKGDAVASPPPPLFPLADRETATAARKLQLSGRWLRLMGCMAVPAVLEYSLDAPLVKVARHRPQPRRPGSRPLRAKIREFSRKSQSRLRRCVGRVNRRVWKGALFVTLTLHPDVYPGGRGAKRYLDRWLQEVRKRFPGVYYLWKMEYHKTGRVHFHCLLFGIDAAKFEREARWLWWQIVRPPEAFARHHLRVVKNALVRGCHVERVKSSRFAALYVAKYVGKGFGGDIPAEESPGRFWGKCRDFTDLWARFRVVVLERGKDASGLWRQLRKLRRGPKRGWWKVCAGPRYVFVNDASVVERLLTLLGIRHRLLDTEGATWNENRKVNSANSWNLAAPRFERFGVWRRLSNGCMRQLRRAGTLQARSFACSAPDALGSGLPLAIG